MAEAPPSHHIAIPVPLASQLSQQSWHRQVEGLSKDENTIIINPAAPSSDILAVRLHVTKQLEEETLGYSAVRAKFILKQNAGGGDVADLEAALREDGFRLGTTSIDYIREEAEFAEQQTGCAIQPEVFSVLDISLNDLVRNASQRQDEYKDFLETIRDSRMVSTDPKERDALSNTIAEILQSRFHSFSRPPGAIEAQEVELIKS